MLIAFRTDASLDIGTGHVMRCLTLAEALAARGADCRFICRDHEGNLNQMIRKRGFVVHALPVLPKTVELPLTSVADASLSHETAHGHWLGTTQEQDADACMAVLANMRPDWLIVDHYALDATWELRLERYCDRLMVIDDLADRPHSSDLLLDQTFGRGEVDYQLLVPPDCRILCGSQYSLLRPEFSRLRDYSLRRRAEPELRNLLVTMGGVDKENVTGRVLEAFRACTLPTDFHITVVMGETSPWLSQVGTLARSMPRPTQIQVGITNMAELMANADLAIGAAGATSWERCCLGLPTILLVLADNQRKVARNLFQAGAVQVITDTRTISQQLPVLLDSLHQNRARLEVMSRSAAQITDGLGAAAVAELLES